jgi:hypothetical protein
MGVLALNDEKILSGDGVSQIINRISTGSRVNRAEYCRVKMAA